MDNPRDDIFSRITRTETNDLIWQCINVMGHYCEGYSDDKRVNCALCPKLKEGIERRKKAREKEEETIIGRVEIESGEEFLLIDKGNSFLFVIGKRNKDDPRPDRFVVKKSAKLTFNNIGSLSMFFYLVGLLIMNTKQSPYNK